MPRGRTHYVVGDKEKTTCGIDCNKVFNTKFRELVTCHNCKWSLVYRTKRENK